MSTQVTHIEGTAAPLVLANINTDVIVRIERLAEHGKGELGPYAFEAWRRDSEGRETDFVLNQAAYRRACVLIAGRNFGCGSSREGAVWALQDFGFRCLIAPSFGDIFYNNCFQNGLLPVVLAQSEIDALASEAASRPDGRFCIDLTAQRIITPAGHSLPFAIDPVKRNALLEGRDELSITLSRVSAIDEFQQQDRRVRPWIYELPDT